MNPTNHPGGKPITMTTTTTTPWTTRRRRPFIEALALVAGLTVLAVLTVPTPARAQETTGRINGRVTDMGTGQPLSGITVILQGEQGEDAALTDERGEYSFVNLQVGKYVVRFYNATSTTKVERPDLTVSAGATLRADAAIPSQAAVEETYVIKKKAAAVDVGSARLGMTVDEDYMRNVPVDLTFGDLMLKAPGAFLEQGSGAVSIAGSSGLENVYIVNGLNATGMDFGDIMSKRPDASGGSNLTLDFVKEFQVNTGGYNAEFGGAMGGVVNVVTKSGSNDYHGTAFLYWAPYWMSADPKLVLKNKSALVGVDKPDYDTNVGFEVGGPIIKNKLFFWAGFAPRFEKKHFFRDVQALVDADGDGVQDIDPATGQPVTNFLLRTRTRELRKSFEYGVKIDWLAAPDHHMTIGFFQTPSYSEHVRAFSDGAEAVNSPGWALQGINKINTDVMINWVSQLLDRRLRIDASVGLHRESFSDESPYDALNQSNQKEWHNASLFDLEHIAGCEPQPYTDASGASQTFDPCPVDNYHNGGYGQIKKYTGNRWMADLKGTYLFPHNEVKAGIHLEYNIFDQTRWYSGPLGNRALIQNNPDPSFPYSIVYTSFTLPPGVYPSQFADASATSDDPNGDGKVLDLAGAPYYKDALKANVKSLNTAYFIQDSVHPLSNLTVDIGVRLENQRMYDFRGNEFLNLVNLGPRVGAVFDPSDEGRSKIFAHFGQFYEAIPMNLAARYFGGEGILSRYYDQQTPATGGTCKPGQTPKDWTGSSTIPGGEWNDSGCALLFAGTANNGGAYPVQANIKGQHHNEIVAGFRHALTPDLVVGVDYTHRWLGAVIEDGTGDGTNFIFALGNPGDVPKATLDQLNKDITSKQAQIDATPDAAQKVVLTSQLNDLKAKLTNLTALGSEPKPERTYDAITLSAVKRLARNWMLSASYTYSKLIGNYNGLFDADNSYAAPNGSNFYDTPELALNRRGPLANDRPHAGRIDGYYTLPVGPGSVLYGISFSAYSGVPRNYIAQWVQGFQDSFLLPRGSAGRTPPVTQTDIKLGYHYQLSKTTAAEAFLDLYNIFNERTVLLYDDNYTFDRAAPIVNGTVADLAYARNADGLPILKNPNFGKGTVFQAPFHGRVGLRFLF